MHSRDAYPQFADVWVPPGYHIELLRISEYVFPITPGYLASLQAGFKSDVHDVGVVQIIQRHDQLASHISLHR